MRNFPIKLFNAIALVAFFGACSDQNTAGGISEETEGIIAISNKNLAGAAQKGPLVIGSEVVLKETSADGTLEPTGRVFYTTITGDKGDFTIDSIDLVCQYALLSAEGHYKHETNGELSECSMRLDAVSNLANRSTSNINLLTHFEYKRVLNLVKSGKSFAQAKKQASAEVLAAFGVKVDISSAEDLNIFNTSEADRTLYNISLLIDDRYLWDPWDGEGDEMDHWTNKEKINCSRLQNYIDRIADDIADDGAIDDSTMKYIATFAYQTAMDLSRMEYIDEADMVEKDKKDTGSYTSLKNQKKQYEFGYLVFTNYMEIEKCTEDIWGNYRQFNKPIVTFNEYGEESTLDSGYVLCNGNYWEMKTKGYIDSLTTPIEHQSGTMTDPRDGKQYKTVSFTYKDKNYEWMAEDLKYAIQNSQDSSAYGFYSWAAAMQIDENTTDTIQLDTREEAKSDEEFEKYKRIMIKAPTGAIDSIHQGVCPTGWHIANILDWENLIAYVGSINNLLNEHWKTDSQTAHAKDLMGIFYNRFDFNLEPTDKQFPRLYYHSYAHDSFFSDAEAAEYNTLRPYLKDYGSIEEEWARKLLSYYRSNRNADNTTFEIRINYASATSETQPSARVRCVRN